MLLNIARSLAFLILLPAIGVAVAAATITQPIDQEGDSPIVAEPLSQAVVANGLQDQSEYSHVVKLDAAGRFNGEILNWTAAGDARPAAGLPIRISQRGSIVAMTQTDAFGQFSIEGMAPGVYSVFGQNSECLFAAAVYVAAHGSTSVGADRLSNVGISAENIAEVGRIRRFNLPTVAFNEDEQTNANTYAKVMRQSFFSSGPVEDIEIGQLIEEMDAEVPSVGVENQIVTLTNGEVRGQLAQIFGRPIDFRAIHCFLVQNGSTVAEVSCDADGAFVFSGVTPGIYGFVAAGTGGFAALSLNIVGEEPAQVQSDLINPVVFASHRTAAAQVAVALVSQEDSGDINQDESQQQPPFAFEPGFPGGGSVGGGGGGGGGGAGGGALAALAIGGLAAAVIASDDDNNAQFASPFFP